MKIGILYNTLEALENHELRIINEIIQDQSLELVVLIQDNQLKHDSKKLLTRRIFIESKKYKNNNLISLSDVKNTIKNIDQLNIIPEKVSLYDTYSIGDINIIRSYQLDVIVKFGFNDIGGQVLTSSKYGVWSLCYADYFKNRSGVVGFWETKYQDKIIKVSLLKLTDDMDNADVIDQASFNCYHSLLENRINIQEGSVLFLLKNLRKIQKGSVFNPMSAVYYERYSKSPSVTDVLGYILSYYSDYIKRHIRYKMTSIFKVKYDCWTLFIGKGDFMKQSLYHLTPVSLKKNEFWADPFIFQYKENNYVFFEAYDYSQKKGRICCGLISGTNLVDIKEVLELDYHLSYPYIFEEEGNIYLMPETNGNNRMEIYICIEFPCKWKLYSTAFEGEKVIDPFFYTDALDQRWLFVNKKCYDGPSNDNALFIYKVDSLKLNHLKAHQQNPITIDSTKGRNGGTIFKYNGNLYRPSQASIEGVYGRGLNLNRIKKLTLSEYVEETEIRVFPNFDKRLVSMHHLNQKDGIFVFDAAYKRK